MKGLQVVRGRAFTDEKIDCNNIHFVNCAFNGCILVRDANSRGYFENTTAHWCKIEGDGWTEGERSAFAILAEAPTTRRHEAEVVARNAQVRVRDAQSIYRMGFLNRLKEADRWASRGKSA